MHRTAAHATRQTTLSHRRARFAISLSLAIGLLGCGSSIDLHTPAPPLPPTAASDATAATASDAASAPSNTEADTAPAAVIAAVPSSQITATELTASPPTDAPLPGSVPYPQRADVQAWIADVAQRTALPTPWLQAAFAEARYQPNVARFILPPPSGSPKNWAAYRARFVEPRRIKAGAAFWSDNEAWLQEAQQRYGVPAELIVGLIGVETLYGRDMGRFRILDALVTLGFDFPPQAPRDRSPYFRGELEHFFLLCRDIRANPLDINSSYAGAIGMPQFMPGSWRKYGVDFDGDGHIDLIHSPADVIGSVANFLAEHGWTPGVPTHFDALSVPPSGDALNHLLSPDILPSFTAAELVQHGVVLPPDAQRHGGLMALVKLENGTQPASYVIGTDNFYAITRYNQSSPYAMAVIDLGRAVARERQRPANAP